MIDLNFDPPPQEPAKSPDIVPIFLGLFLLVLAFFIMLVSISTFEKVKSTAVMDSLSSTFTSVLPPTSNPTDFNSKDGDILAGQAFQEEITAIFSTAVQVERIEVVQPGRLMHLRFRASEIFQDQKTELREDQTPLLDRIVAALSNRPPGLRQDMEIVSGTRVIGDSGLPVAQNIQMARMGELARALTSRGAPPDSITVGIKDADPGTITIWFWVRAVEETTEQFEAAMEEMRKQSGAVPTPTTTVEEP